MHFEEMMRRYLEDPEACDGENLAGVYSANEFLTRANLMRAYDPSFDFSAASTWAMPDSVVPIAVDGAFNVYDHALDSTILATVAANMDALGYTRESDPDANGADLVVLVHANVSDSYPPFTPYAWDDTWDWYSGWSFWGGVSGYGSAYPWYVLPPGTDVADVPTGSIIIEIFDPNEPTSTSSGPGLPARWVAILNGLASVDSESRVTTAIDQAFDQSPYLGT